MASDWRIFIREHPRFGTYYRAVESRPSWVTRIALLCAVLVVVVPLVLLVLAAVLVGLVVFFVLGLIATVANAVQGLFDGGASSGTPEPTGPASGGRENVRVIRD